MSTAPDVKPSQGDSFEPSGKTEIASPNAIPAIIEPETKTADRREMSMSQSNSAIAPEAVEEIRRLATAFRTGESNAKADLKKLGGESSELAQAVNQLIDAAIVQLKESVRARQALDVTTSSVMIADANNVVRYANSSVLDMLRASETELRQDLPDFQVTKIVGSNIDVFHKNPAHQKRMVASMNSTFRTQISIGGKVFGLVATPIFDDQGARIGTVVEWLDRTTEVRIEKELAAAIEATTRGDFSKQIDMTGAEGVFKLLGGHINSMISNTGDCLNSISNVLDQLARGNVSASDKLRSYEGAFGELQGSAVRLQETLRKLMSELTYMSSEHDKGDIDVIIDVSKFDNDFAKVASGINAMVDGHISVKKKAMACVAEFGRGNFEAELERFPGKKAFINEIVEQVRSNLKLLVEDANMLASAATEGRLQTRADANRHFGDFRRIIQGVNDTLDSVIEPMNNISAAIEALGRNDMGVRLEGDYRGDFLSVKTSFERALDGINRTLFEIVDAVDQVGKSSEQLSGASQSMASNSEEQASAVEEVTSSLTQTNSQVQANTENAKAANQLVIGASQTASEGQAKMEAMTDAMNAIAAASQNIGKIIKVIDEIAFQTNLLALNAAVEAARAGQHGRGFAVVAQEVRNLAGRSAKAARETADMIEDTVKRVNDGVNIAKETREALDTIVTNVVKVKDLVAEIATASTEQSRGVAQINVAMTQVGKAAQDGSKQAEELAAASTELSSLAAQMQESVRRFKLRERKTESSSFSLDGLSGLPDELLSQLKALIAQQSTGFSAPASRPAAAVAAGGARRPASAIIPLDKDERGFGNF